MTTRMTIQSRIKRILKKGIMSPLLRTALEDSLEALGSGNKNLAYQLTACKSFIVGTLDPQNTRSAFQESQEKNQTLLGDSIYSLLDGIHYDLAFELDAMPSGMMVLSSNGVQEMKHIGAHHVIIRMNEEHRAIYEACNPCTTKNKRKVQWHKKSTGTV